MLDAWVLSFDARHFVEEIDRATEAAQMSLERLEVPKKKPF
jgi:hypothetical protein